eukprot:scaffold3759_cov169-Amphora_coffeaeformis.AAC.5
MIPQTCDWLIPNRQLGNSARYIVQTLILQNCIHLLHCMKYTQQTGVMVELSELFCLLPDGGFDGVNKRRLGKHGTKQDSTVS